MISGAPHDEIHDGDGPKTKETPVKGLPVAKKMDAIFGRTTEKTDGKFTAKG